MSQLTYPLFNRVQVYQPSISPDEGAMLEDAATQSSLVDTQPIPPPVATTYHQPDSSASKKAPEVRFAEDEGGPISPGAEIRRTMSMADNMQDPAAVEQVVEGTSPTIPIHDSAPVVRRTTPPACHLRAAVRLDPLYGTRRPAGRALCAARGGVPVPALGLRASRPP